MANKASPWRFHATEVIEGCPKASGRAQYDERCLADLVASDTGSTKADARKTVDLVFAALGEAAVKGEDER